MTETKKRTVKPKRKTAYERLHAVIESTGVVPKAEAAGGIRFKFHSVDDVVAYLRPHMIHHGLAFAYTVEENKTQVGETNGKAYLIIEKKIRLSLHCVDDPDEQITGVEHSHSIGGPNDHGSGKATSYAVKTWLLNMFMLRGQPDAENFPTNANINPHISTEQVKELDTLLLHLPTQRRKGFFDWASKHCKEEIEKAADIRVSNYKKFRQQLTASVEDLKNGSEAVNV